MDASEIKLVIEAALLAAGRPLPFEKLVELLTRKGDAPDRATIREALEALSADYAERGIELKEVGSGFRIQVRSSMADWLQPLWEERAPRYTRALLETLALIAYRQPITRSEIEEVRGVAVSSNIVRTLMERGWVRVVGHRDVPGKPAMLGTTREFLDYFGLKKLEDLPALAEFNEDHPQMSPQGDFLDPYAEEEADDEDGARPQLAAVPNESGEGGEDEVGIVATAEIGADEGAEEDELESPPGAASEPGASVAGGPSSEQDDSPEQAVSDDAETRPGPDSHAAPTPADPRSDDEEARSRDDDGSESAQQPSGWAEDQTPDTEGGSDEPPVKHSESGGL